MNTEVITNITTSASAASNYTTYVIWACIILIPVVCFIMRSIGKVNRLNDGKHPLISFNIDSIDSFTYEEKDPNEKFSD